MKSKCAAVVVLSSVLLTLGSGAAQELAEPARPDLATRIDQAVRTAMAAHELPGAAVAVVRAGKTEFVRGYGLADVERAQKVDPQRTIFRIGSISKALTLLTVCRLIDDGRLDANADVSQFLDGIRNPHGFERPVTINNLLTHTTGFDQLGGSDRQVRRFDLSLAERKALRPELGSYLSANRLRRVTPAGLYYRYDTYGTSLAGAILARVCKRPYPEAMRREMFEPLGMSSSFVEAPPSAIERVAIGYEEEQGDLVRQGYEVYVTTPASSIDATVADMARLLEALTSDGANDHGRLFSAGMARAVLAPQFRPHPEFLGTTHGLHESMDAGEDVGVPKRTVDHGGTMAGFKSLMAILPESRIGVFVVTNKSGGGRNPLAGAVMSAVVASLGPSGQRPTLPVPERDAARNLSEYAGDYFYGVFAHSPTPDEVANGAWRRGRPRVVTAERGALTIGDEEYLPRGGDVFVRVDGQRMVFFGRDSKGRVAWFNYSSSPDTFERELPEQPYVEVRSLAQSVYETVRAQGIDAAVRHFEESVDSGRFYLREEEMNRVGYALLRGDQEKAAVRIFQLVVERFPRSFNAHDSLGEAHAAVGDDSKAIASYRRSIELNPDNAGGRAALKRLLGK